MLKEYFTVNSPLKVIGLMIGLCEIGFGILSSQINIPNNVLWAMILLPFLISILFFIILFFRPNNLYSPSDFFDQKDFLVLQDKVNMIEEIPFIKFSKLEEPAIRLFLSAYYELKNPKNKESRQQRWNDLVNKFNDNEIDKALDVLVEYKWLSKGNSPFDLTKQGRDAHELLKHFVYGRLG
ncbi:MAG: hypothetical protein KJ915_10285 [Candidatus Omnitrophica bacterium]|nr:hypothetical protein [Candidatus Omnitrophota bacterium]